MLRKKFFPLKRFALFTVVYVSCLFSALVLRGDEVPLSKGSRGACVGEEASFFSFVLWFCLSVI